MAPKTRLDPLVKWKERELDAARRLLAERLQALASARARAEAAGVARAREALSKELQRPATDDEVATRLGIEVTELCHIEGVTRPPSPLLPEMLQALTASAEDQVQTAEIRQMLVTAVGQLPERLQILLSLHYVEDLTYQEISEVLKVSQPRVSQLHSEAIKQLRATLQGSER